MNKRTFLKISAILSFIFITLALILIKLNSPVTGYELSLYASLPPVTWIFLVGTVILGISIIVIEAFGEREDNFWYFGFLILIMCNLIILSLHIIRGYFMITISDSIGHMNMISSVVSMGNINGNIYPLTHILGAYIVEICSIDERGTVKIIPIFFSIISMIFTYLLASEVFVNRSHSMLAAASGSTLTYSYYHISTYPQTIALFTFPLFFYLYFKAARKTSVSFIILFIILLIIFPLIHPFMEIVVICCLASGEIARVLWQKRVLQITMREIYNKLFINPFLLSLIVYVTWEWNFPTFEQLGDKFLNYFISSEVKETPRAQEVQYISQKAPKDMTALVAKMYGDQFIYLLLSVIAILIILWYFYKKNEKYDKLFILSTFFCVCGPVYFLLFMSLGQTTIGRLVGANACLWVIPMLAGFSLYEFFKRLTISRKSIAAVVVTLVIVSSTVLGIFNVYRSPFINQPNTQITEMDLKGVSWVDTSNSRAVTTGYLGWPAGYNEVEFPPHFGNPNLTLAENLKQNMTVIFTEKFRLAAANPILSKNSVTTGGMSAEGFNSSDLKRLEQDITVSWLYSNGEFDVLQVNTKGESNESSVDR